MGVLRVFEHSFLSLRVKGLPEILEFDDVHILGSTQNAELGLGTAVDEIDETIGESMAGSAQTIVDQKTGDMGRAGLGSDSRLFDGLTQLQGDAAVMDAVHHMHKGLMINEIWAVLGGRNGHGIQRLH